MKQAIKKIIIKIMVLIIGIFVIALLPINSNTGATLALIFFGVCCAWIIIPIYKGVSLRKKEKKEEQERIAREKIIEAQKVKAERRKASAEALLAAPTVVFDTETTGLTPGRDEIIQFSAIDGNGNTLISSYIKPEHRKTWKAAEEVNHISPAMVKGAPSLDDLREQIEEIMNSAKVIVGYNTEFDLDFLREGLGYNPRKDQIVFDVMTEFAPIYGQWSEYHGDYTFQKLNRCAKHYGYKWEGQEHDALADVKATLFCYKEMLKRDYKNLELELYDGLDLDCDVVVE